MLKVVKSCEKYGSLVEIMIRNAVRELLCNL